jgi:hypothetical protein
MEFFDPLELKRAQFNHYPVHVGSGGAELYQRISDIPTDKCREAACPEYLSAQGSRSGLAIGAGDCDHGCIDKTAGQLDLADHPALPGPRQLEWPDLHRDSGTHHDQI